MLVLTLSIMGACLVLAGWAGVRAIRDRPVIFVQLIAGAVVVAAILAQMVMVAIALSSGGLSADPWLLWGYLITAVLLLPGAGWWALLDRTRWSSVVLVVAAFTIVVMQLRIWQIQVVG